MTALFGPAGNSNSFSASGNKSVLLVPEYIVKQNLDCYEYQCGHGVRIAPDTAKKLGEKARENDIRLSLHAPYYVSLASVELQKRENSIKYILDSAKVADFMGATRVIVHPGSCGKFSRQAALELAKGTLGKAIAKLDEEDLGHITICPETMGKTNQLGNLDEVMELCRIDERLIPCIDFGHLNARSFGGLTNGKGYKDILDIIEDKLGAARVKVFHSHFSKIEYTIPGGEKRHLTFEDKRYGPEFEPLAEQVAIKGLTPTFICESRGTQAEDAVIMKKIYSKYLKKIKAR